MAKQHPIDWYIFICLQDKYVYTNVTSSSIVDKTKQFKNYPTHKKFYIKEFDELFTEYGQLILKTYFDINLIIIKFDPNTENKIWNEIILTNIPTSKLLTDIQKEELLLYYV
jgi:hypothetical protein